MAASMSASLGFGMAGFSKSFALSLIKPVGSPFASRMIRPPSGSGVLRSMRSQFQRERIQQRDVLIQAHDRDRRVRRDRVDPCTRGQLAAPHLFVPVTALQPLPGSQRLSRILRSDR